VAELTAKKVVKTKGKREKLQSATYVETGDVLEYAVVYSNRGRKAVSALVATLPIPVGMTYIEDSAVPAKVEASIDGQSFYPVPLLWDVRTHKLLTKQESLAVISEHVPVANYRALRWQMPMLKPKGDFTARARVSLVTATPK
jgi:uncharacterized repeat protein (TIGR01451 family)